MKTKRKQLRIITPAKTQQLPERPESKSIVQLANIKTGRLVKMSAKAAILLCSKYPKEFKIL